MLDLIDTKGKKDIKSMTLEEVTAEMTALGEKSFRAKQLYDWLHVKLAESFDDMSTLSKDLRQKLKENYSLTALQVAGERISAIDGTRKYLFRLEDGNVIESVWMQYHHGNSVCISSQVGCRMGCRFCASTLDGMERNLRPSEMLDQIYRIQTITGERVSNIVVMGSGEPMDNYDNVVRFIRLISNEKGLNISQRNLTISTCGIVPGIKKFAEEGLQVTLALSLHAPNDEVRKTLMPIANSFKLKDVLEACHYYFEKTGRRLTFEYSLVKGVNDNLEEAKALTELIKDQHGHVNLIPVNPIKERDYVQSDRKAIEQFKNYLEKHGINATVRREMGRDIGGACGQLRKSYLEEGEIEYFNQKLLKNFSLQSVLENLTILNAQKLLDYVSDATTLLQQMLKRRFLSKTVIGINMHICFLIERLVTKTPIENYENLDAFEAEQQEFINIVNESFHTLVSHYNVELPVSEIAYLHEYIKNDVKVEGNENQF